jgi:hypothetical protein
MAVSNRRRHLDVVLTMKVLRPWLVAVALWTTGVATLYVRCPGCLDRARENRACEWTGDTAARLDRLRAADWEHLVLDAQLAEELATRYADAVRLNINGVEGHGGLIEGGAVVRGCMTRMVAAIYNNHGVAEDQILAARAQRNGVYDAVVLTLFLPLYCFGAALVHRRLRRRFASDRPSVQRLATIVASAPAALVGAQLPDSGRCCGR